MEEVKSINPLGLGLLTIVRVAGLHWKQAGELNELRRALGISELPNKFYH